MNLSLTPATSEDAPRLDALFELYVYDFSEILGLDIGDEGRFRVPPLGSYFVDPERHAFLARVDGKLAGFALVSERSRLTGDRGTFDMAEFFVLRRFRRQGVGDAIAKQVFDRFVGPWEVRQRHENVGATAFWRRVIAKRVGRAWDEEAWDDPSWRGVVQRFVSGGRA